MASIIGKHLKVSIFGQSHAAGIGCVIDGLPAGESIDLPLLSQFLARRAPGSSPLATARKEADIPEIISGLYQEQTCGAPICAIIRNTDTRSADYAELADKPRPGHADYPAHIRYGGAQDVRGGGHFSGRLTAPLCIAGGICLQILNRYGIDIGAHIYAIHNIYDDPFDPCTPAPAILDALTRKPFPTINDKQGAEMQSIIQRAKDAGDSVGGMIECTVLGLPAGIGDPIFDGMENRLSAALFGIPAIKAISFGDGYESGTMFGSENNDAMTIENGRIITKTNHAGGILGGITTGMPLWFRCTVKPTPSIAKEQQTISLSAQTDTLLSIHGRHDPCIVPRAVPCVIAATAIVVLDAILDSSYASLFQKPSSALHI